jgi:DNA repair protein RecN (Recombination protein N)
VHAGEDLIVRRVISSAGRTGSHQRDLANLTTLAALGTGNADIHGQHEHQSLLSLEHQMEMSILSAISAKSWMRSGRYGRLSDVRKTGETRPESVNGRSARKCCVIKKNEIEAAMLKPGEDEELANEQKFLSNAESWRDWPPWWTRRCI